MAAAVANRPILMQQVVGGGVLPDSSVSASDSVIPNSATQRLIAASNVSRVVATTSPYLAPLPAASGAFVNFIYGYHGSILDPRGTSVTAATNYATFAEMQTEAVAFALAQGAAVTVANPAVTQP